MSAHYDISMKFQTFLFSTKIKTINENIPIDLSIKYIGLAYHLEC